MLFISILSCFSFLIGYQDCQASAFTPHQHRTFPSQSLPLLDGLHCPGISQALRISSQVLKRGQFRQFLWLMQLSKIHWFGP
ncbi:hypothetical protein RchiOBHm_Chr1g0332611 [Rosa chinensis]|uniref:Secreted protein n=1 Tax=Rosa chinensis TaxID=74649 RepID=A0A2P6SBX2_ROSCH|nr:hypothetical protein RchiOBHm_Chr1g0332611 [Rosa chinensis]